MTKDQLLIPRVMCVGTEPGTPNDTSGIFISGTVLYESDEVRFFSDIGNTTIYYPYLRKDIWITADQIKKLPHLFRPMPWWEGRKPDEMPEFLKDISSETVLNVKTYSYDLDVFLADNGLLYPTRLFTPSTREEYEAYISSKNK